MPGEDVIALDQDDDDDNEEDEEDDEIEEDEEEESGSVTNYGATPSDTHTPTNPTAVCCRSSTISSLKEDTVSTDTVIPPDSTR